MQVGDEILFYHSSCPVPGIYGIAEVVSLPHPDETQFIIGDKHYDAKSTHEKPIWHCIDVGFVQKLSQPITLSEIRTIPELSTMKILERGNRLSITPVSEEEYHIRVFPSYRLVFRRSFKISL